MRSCRKTILIPMLMASCLASLSADSELIQAPPMHLARANHTATLLKNGTVLIAGGDLISNSAQTNTAEIYNPTTGTWRYTRSPMNVARSNQTATLLPNGRVLIAGGYSAPPESLSSAEIYDPTTETFSLTGSMSMSRYFSNTEKSSSLAAYPSPLLAALQSQALKSTNRRPVLGLRRRPIQSS